jgi:hypothetical protein
MELIYDVKIIYADDQEAKQIMRAVNIINNSPLKEHIREKIENKED